jgi:hypothetical protein
VAASGDEDDRPTLRVNVVKVENATEVTTNVQCCSFSPLSANPSFRM